MNPVVLYLLLLKAALTSFSGMTSVPVVREDLVVRRRVLTDRELNAAIGVSRAAPGPNGLYMVGVGYAVAGIPGALAGAAAVVTPAFLVIPLVRYVGRRAGNPAVRRSIQAVVLAGAGLVLAAAIPLAVDALDAWWKAAVALGACVAMVVAKVDPVWVIVAAGLVGLVH
ncbi:MAG: chromate transporter [Acidobacteria bacterium]|nr:chromate transporter [Acidobacteriota bacterium]